MFMNMNNNQGGIMHEYISTIKVNGKTHYWNKAIGWVEDANSATIYRTDAQTKEDFAKGWQEGPVTGTPLFLSLGV